MNKKSMLEVRDWRIVSWNMNQKPLTLQMWMGKRLSVGALGFEPRASCTPCKRASRTAPRPALAKSILLHGW
jgi:hypothetical protein